VLNAVSASFATSASQAENANTASYVLQCLSFATSASQAENANTASYVLNAVSASFATSASQAENANTASYVLNAVSASFATSASQAQTANTASYVLNAVSASFATSASQAQTANTASYVLNAVSASFATSASQAENANTASYVLNAVSASFATSASQAENANTASYVLNAVSASFATSASQAENANTASYVLNVVSASFATSASQAQTANTASYVLNVVSASFATSALSASYAVTASHANFAVSSSQATSASFVATASFSNTSISASFATNALTASYVEYSNVANKPALVSGSSQVTYSGLTGIPSGIVSGSSQITYSGLTGIPSGIVSGSSQVSFNGIVDKPTLVSGSSQITYSGLTGIPSGIVSGSSQVTYSGLTGIPSGIVSGSAQVTYSGLTGVPSGIVSGSAQIADFGIFATTGSNGFNGDQAITGSLTVTGQVVAQTLNVQQVTSSIVYSSGSNVFGNELSNTQQFTGSVGVTGSLTVNGTSAVVGSGTTNYLPKFTGASTIGNSIVQDNGSTITVGGSVNASGLIINNNGEALRAYGLSPNVSFYNSANTVRGGYVNHDGSNMNIIADVGGLSFSGSATFSGFLGTVNQNNGIKLTNNVGTIVGLEVGGSNDSYIGTISDSNFSIRTANNPIITVTSSGNVGIGTTDTQTFRLAVDGPNVSQGDVDTTIRIFDTTSATTGTGGGISFAGYFNGTTSFINTLSYIKGGKENSTADNYAAYLAFGTRINGGTPTERMRITSGGNVGIGTASPSDKPLTIYNSNSATLYQTPTSGTTNTSGFYVGQTSDVSYVWNYNNFPLVFGTNNTERMHIFAGGNTHIGPTPAADNGARLQVSGRTQISGGSLDFSTLTDLGIVSALTTGRSGTYQSNSLASISTRGDASSIELIAGISAGFYTGISATANNASTFTGVLRLLTAGSEQMRITNGGSVGIGTSNPTNKLTIQSNSTQLRLETASDPSNYHSFIESNYNSANPLNIYSSAAASYAFGTILLEGISGVNTYVNSYYGLVFGTGSSIISSGTVRGMVTQEGNWLIGTTTDNGARLQVSGTSTFSGTYTYTGGNNTIVSQSNTATTGYQYHNMQSTGARLIWGIEGNPTLGVFNNTLPNAAVIGSASATGAFQIATASTVRLTIASTGAATFSSTVAATQGNFTSAPSIGGHQVQAVSNSGSNTSYGGVLVISSTGKGGYLTSGDNSTTTWYGAQASFVTLGGTAGTGMKFRVNADDNTGITIPTSGNVLIGTTTDVNGRLQVLGADGAVISQIKSASGMVQIYPYYGAYGGPIIQALDGGAVGYVPLRIEASSTTFSSSVTATGLIINNNGEALRAYGVSPNVSFYNSANTVRGGFVNHDGSNMNIVADVGGLSFTGSATFSSSVTATSFFESSDATLKTLVADNYQAKGIDSVVAKLYIKNGKQELGYYAQDLQEVLPSAVSKGSDGLLNLSYREVHTAKIAYLEEKIKQLENELGKHSK
jgi:fibronectin-binding autotransporter adhesin